VSGEKLGTPRHTLIKAEVTAAGGACCRRNREIRSTAHIGVPESDTHLLSALLEWGRPTPKSRRPPKAGFGA
jgi:hypothetical protein